MTNGPDVADLDELMRRIRAELRPREMNAKVPPAPAPRVAALAAPVAAPVPASASLFQRLKRKRGIRSVVALRHGVPAIRLLPEVKERAEKTEARLFEVANAIDLRLADAEREAQARKQALDEGAAALRKMVADVAKASHLEQLEARVTKLLATEIERLEGRHAETMAGNRGRIEQLEARVTKLLATEIERLEDRHAETMAGNRGRIEQLEHRSTAAFDQIGQLVGRVGATELVLATMEQRLAELAPLSHVERQTTQINGEIARMRMKLADQWREAVNQKLRLDVLLVEARRRLPEAFDRSQLARVADEQEHALDAFYVTFEDRWRGTRADIKNRQRVYLSRVETAVEATGGALVVDVGCGRGEWLELLQDNGITAKGYDLNRIMVTECQERGLDVTLGDALEAIRAMPDDSVTVITGFHIIEHIPFSTVVNMFDECLRVLRPHGLMVFETPNPANLQVAAERFYYDPTHRNPLPSELVAFVAESRGFSRVEVLPLHPIDAPVQTEYGDPMLELLRQKLFGAQDYGVIAWKDR